MGGNTRWYGRAHILCDAQQNSFYVFTSSEERLAKFYIIKTSLEGPKCHNCFFQWRGGKVIEIKFGDTSTRLK